MPINYIDNNLQEMNKLAPTLIKAEFLVSSSNWSSYAYVYVYLLYAAAGGSRSCYS